MLIVGAPVGQPVIAVAAGAQQPRRINRRRLRRRRGRAVPSRTAGEGTSWWLQAAASIRQTTAQALRRMSDPLAKDKNLQRDADGLDLGVVLEYGVPVFAPEA